jgi:E3 ubiquitin-protein ligase FANCL
MDRTLRANLEELLEMRLPSPETTPREEYSVECAICYVYRLGDAFPEIVCCWWPVS